MGKNILTLENNFFKYNNHKTANCDANAKFEDFSPIFFILSYYFMLK
jgi:hypothetical protein